MNKIIAWNSGTGNITLTYSGEGNDTVTVASDANNLTVERSQTLTFKTSSITRQVTVTQLAKEVIEATFVGYPVSYDEETAEWYSTSQSVNNAYDGSNSSNYFQIYLTRGSRAETYCAFNFDTSSIPSNATIKSVTCTAKVYCSNTQSNRVATRNIQLYSGSTAKGSAHTMSASTTAFSLDCGTWSRSELDNIKLVLHCIRGTNSTSSNYYLRFYGATLTVEYEY